MAKAPAGAHWIPGRKPAGDGLEAHHARLSGREEARVASVLKDAERAYGAFAEVKPFWS